MNAQPRGPRAANLGWGVFAALGVACTSELHAPDCYNDGLGTVPRCQVTGADFDSDTLDTASATSGTGTLQLECAAPPGAVGANYRYVPVLSGAATPVVWMARGLPPSLQVDPEEGTIFGIPDAPGDVMVTLDVLDASGATTSAVCSFAINPALTLDLGPLFADGPGCIEPGGSLADFLEPTSGDQTPLLCDTPSGLGNGRRPPGVTVDPTTCVLQGDIDEPGVGTWVFVVRARQSGRELYAPYCITDDAPDDGAYTMTVEHSGLDADESTYRPLVRTYDPASPWVVGGNDDPLFRIVDPNVCRAGCAYRYQFGLTASLFDPDSLSLAPEQVLRDTDTDASIGFSHNLLLSGPDPSLPNPEGFADRPWVLGMSFDYCMSDDSSDCSDAEGAFANPNGHLEFSIIMVGREGA